MGQAIHRKAKGCLVRFADDYQLYFTIAWGFFLDLS